MPTIYDPSLTPLSPPAYRYTPDPDVIACRSSPDKAIVQVVFARPEGTYGFRYHAWVNFADAGSNPHHTWTRVNPSEALITDQIETAKSLAANHAARHDAEFDNWSSPAD